MAPTAIGLPSACHRPAIGLPSACHRPAIGPPRGRRARNHAAALAVEGLLFCAVGLLFLGLGSEDDPRDKLSKRVWGEGRNAIGAMQRGLFQYRHGRTPLQFFCAWFRGGPLPFCTQGAECQSCSATMTQTWSGLPLGGWEGSGVLSHMVRGTGRGRFVGVWVRDPSRAPLRSFLSLFWGPRANPGNAAFPIRRALYLVTPGAPNTEFGQVGWIGVATTSRASFFFFFSSFFFFFFF